MGPIWGEFEEDRRRNHGFPCPDLVDGVREGIYVLRDSRFVFTNRELEEMLGYDREELTAPDFPIWEVIAPESRAQVERRRHDREAGLPLPVQYEFLLRRKDGSPLWVSVRSGVIRNGEGTLVVGAVRDITRQKETERQLARQRGLLAAINEVFRETFLGESERDVARKCLLAAVRFTSSSLGFIGEAGAAGSLRLLAVSGGPAPLTDLIARVAGGPDEDGAWDRVQAAGDFELRHCAPGTADRADRSPDPRVVDSYLCVPLRQKGSVFGAIALANPTDPYDPAVAVEVESLARAFVEALGRKRAETALRRSEARHRRFVENAVFGIYRSSPEGRFLRVNPALVEMLGYDSEEELLAVDIAKDVYAESSDRAELIESLSDMDRIRDVEVRWRKKNGEVLLLRLNGRRIHADSEDDGAFEVIVEDVTDRRSLEEQLHRSQRLEAVGQLAGGIAHDFNNLLTVISGQSELSIRAEAPGSEIHGRLLDIRRAALTAGDLTRQLLAFGRRQILDVKTVDLNVLLHDLQRMLRRLISEDIVLEFRCGRDLWAVRADPGQLEQVVMNLAVNAGDAMPLGGTLTIETRNVVLGEEFLAHHTEVAPGPHVVLTVTDTGFGMPPEVRERAFQPFFTTKGEGKGTGLGLATVYGIVKQSRGSIFLESEPGRGTTFEIYLPAQTEAVVGGPPEPADLPPSEGRQEAILLVEDDVGVRQFAAEVLASDGYRVIEAANGEEALRVANGCPDEIDLLLSDVVMPKMSGRELSDALTEARPSTRVLFMSGYTDRAIVHHGVLEEGRRFLQKPFTPDELRRKVRTVLDERPARA